MAGVRVTVAGAGLAARQEQESADNSTDTGSQGDNGGGGDDNPYARWDQQWPAARGPAATEILKALGSMGDQKARAKAHFNLLKAVDSNMHVLNGDNHPVAYVLLKPNEFKARIVYSIGVPMDILSSLNPNELTNFSALMLDLKGGKSYPAAMTFPTTVRDVQTIKVPSATMVDDKSANFPEQWPAWARTDVHRDGEEVEIMQIAPVPFFTVLDGLDHDLDLLEVHERLSSLSDADTEPYVIHAMALLRSGMARYNQADEKPYLKHAIFGQAQSDALYQWAEAKFRAICPAFVPSGGQTGTGSDDLKQMMQLFLASQMNQQVASGAVASPAVQAPAQKSWSEKLNISDMDLELYMLLCGLELGNEEEQLPVWLEKLKQKNTSTGAKDRICVEALGHKIYSSHSPPALKTTLQMMQTQNWLGGELQATYANAMKGLSPFLCTPMSEEAISSWNEMEDALAKAKATSVEDLKAQKRKLTVPENFEGLLKVLKSFVNLLHACFGGRCPLSIELRKTVAALEKYSDGAQNQMTKPTIAAIMWIVLLQTKKFALGHMQIGVHTVVLPEFTVMQNAIMCKNPTIAHAEVPSALLKPPGSKRTLETPAAGDDVTPKTPKKPKADKDQVPKGPIAVKLHTLVQSKLSGILTEAKANRVPVSLICQACDTTPKAVLHPSVCLTGAMYGSCGIRQCKRKHDLITDEQADKILDCFAPIIHDPTKIPTSGKTL